MRIEERVRRPGRVVVVMDPHDGTCRGAHDIIVEATWFPELPRKPGVPEPWTGAVHVSYSWGPSAFLSGRGTAEFRDAINAALDKGLELERELLAEAAKADAIP